MNLDGQHHPKVWDGKDAFRPLPFLGNRHVQTILGHWWRGQPARLISREHRVVLADGDQLVLHETLPAAWYQGQRAALLVHGLGGSHLSGPVQRVATLLQDRGVRVFRIDLRGSGLGAGLARRIYNGGCSDDLRAAVAVMHGLAPSSPIALAGFSLGGNVVLKLAGEAAANPVPGLAQVAAVAPPIDLERCAALLALPRNRLYDYHFVRALVAQVRKQERHFPDLEPARFPRRMTLRRFDDHYTAPRGGFRDALDYYRRASCFPVLAKITVPTLMVTSRDDPFIAVEPFEAFQPPAQFVVQIVSHGGHLGFLGWDGAGGIRWAERRVAEWIASMPCDRT